MKTEQMLTIAVHSIDGVESLSIVPPALIPTEEKNTRKCLLISENGFHILFSKFVLTLLFDTFFC